MAELLGLEKYITEQPEELFPQGMKRISEDEQRLRDVWETRTPEQRKEMLRRDPSISGTIVNTFGPRVKEEMPDELANIRDNLKNFSADVGDQVAWAKEKAPGYDWSFSSRGRILAKKKGTKDYYTLDPDTGFFSDWKEFKRDASDVKSDIASGLAETVGSGVGGAGLGALGLLTGPAAPVAVPVLATLGAAIGGGGSSAVSDYVNQQMSMSRGIRKQYDPEQTKTAAKWGAAVPAIFGSGATKPMVKSVAKSFGKTSAQDVARLYAAQSGIPGQVINNALKSGVSFSTGTDRELLEIAVNNTDLMRKMAVDENAAIAAKKAGVSTDTAKANFLGENMAYKVKKSINSDYERLAEERISLLENMDQIDILPLSKDLDDSLIDVYSEYHNMDIADKKIVDGVMNDIKENLFIETPTEIPHGKQFGDTYYNLKDQSFERSTVPSSRDIPKEALVDAPGMDNLKNFLIDTGHVDGKSTLSLRGTDNIGKNGEIVSRTVSPDEAQYLKEKLDFISKSWQAKTDMKIHPKVKDAMYKLGEARKSVVNEFNAAGKKAGWERFTKGEDPYSYYNNLMRQNRLARKALNGINKDPVKFLANIFSNPKALYELEKASPSALEGAKFLQAYKIWGKRLGQPIPKLKQLQEPSTIGKRRTLARAASLAAYAPALAMDAMNVMSGGKGGGAGIWPYAIGTAVHAGVLGATSPRVIRTAMDATDLIKYLSRLGPMTDAAGAFGRSNMAKGIPGARQIGETLGHGLPVGAGGVTPRAMTEIMRDIDRQRNIN